MRDEPDGPTETDDDRQRCRCGHAPAAHEHYRRGRGDRDCALCLAGECRRYRPPAPFARWLRRATRRWDR